jgi:pimeloyl-ACP methyl ester carboxylesterase
VLGAIGPDALVLAHSYGGTCVLAAVAGTDGARAANAFTPAAGEDVGVRVRFLLGTETAAPLVRSTRAAHAAVPGSSVRGLPGHGHAAMDAAPDLFVAEVSEWLSP